jgi:hypothetical protein
MLFQYEDDTILEGFSFPVLDFFPYQIKGLFYRKRKAELRRASGFKGLDGETRE